MEGVRQTLGQEAVFLDFEKMFSPRDPRRRDDGPLNMKH